MQARLLRILDEGTFERSRSGKTIEVDIRIIATTNRNLDDALRNGQLREDHVRPYGANVDSINPETLNDLEQYSWPGNIRDYMT